MHKSGHIKWLNCAKFVAILAVLVDHTYGILYSNQNIQTATFFSVSLFILIAGITSYMSNSRHNEGWWKAFIRSSKKLVAAYLIAVAVYYILSARSFDPLRYADYVIHFNVSLPHYFVLLYIQLMVAGWPLSRMLQAFKNSKYEHAMETLLFIAVVAFSSFTTNNTSILGVYGGGGKLLGGTYLILYYIGMLIAKYVDLQDFTKKRSIYLALAGGACYAIWLFVIYANGRELIDSHFPFGDGLNPPSISIFVLALAMLAFTAGLFSLLEDSKYGSWMTASFDWLGRWTMTIFLYHMLFLLALDHFGLDAILAHSIWLGRIICYLVMITGPMIIDIVIRKSAGCSRRIVADIINNKATDGSAGTE